MAAENGTLAIWEKLRPFVDNEIAQQTRPCCQMVQMVVTSPYDEQSRTVGVQEAFATTINIPVSGSVDTGKLLKGVSVWVAAPFGNLSNAIVVMLGDGETGYASSAEHANTAENAEHASSADYATNAQNAETAEHANTASDAEKLGGKEAGYYLFTENLLDNTNFVSPYNQNGKQSYSGAVYGIDRWVGMSRTRITLTASGIVLDNTNPTAGSCFWQQLLPEERFAGSTSDDYYTFAVLVNGAIVSTSGKLGTTSAASFNGGSITFLYSSANNSYACRITLNAGYTGSASVQWAVLRKGRYTADDMPPYTAKETAVEQAQCDMYYRIHKATSARGVLGFGFCGAAGSVSVQIPRQKMRAVPNSISVSGSLELYSPATGDVVSVSSFTSSFVSDEYISVSFLGIPFAAGAPVWLRGANDPDAFVVEDANL